MGEDHDRDIDHREAKRPFRQIFLHTGFDRRNVVPRHRPAVNRLVELKAGASRQGFDFDMHVTKLAVSAALLLVAGVLFDRFTDGLLIGDFWPFRFYRDILAFLQLIRGDLEMDIPLAPQQHLARIVIMHEGQRAIFVHQLGNCRR